MTLQEALEKLAEEYGLGYRVETIADLEYQVLLNKSGRPTYYLMMEDDTRVEHWLDPSEPPEDRPDFIFHDTDKLYDFFKEVMENDGNIDDFTVFGNPPTANSEDMPI